VGKLRAVGIELASCVGPLIVIVQDELMRRIIAETYTLTRRKLCSVIKGLPIKLVTIFLTIDFSVD
jgi:DNA repair photolyase